MTKLVSMYGKRSSLGAAPQYQFSLFSMSGAADPTKMDPNLLKDPILTANPLDLSDIDAGIQALYALEYAYPGITFGEILKRSENRLGNMFGDFGNWVSKTVSNAGNKMGDWGGDAVRLLTDKEVRSGLQDYAAAYATGGASAGIQGMIGGEGDQGVFNQVMGFLGSLGKGSKSQVQQAGITTGWGGMDPKILAMGAGGLILLVLLLKK